MFILCHIKRRFALRQSELTAGFIGKHALNKNFLGLFSTLRCGDAAYFALRPERRIVGNRALPPSKCCFTDVAGSACVAYNSRSRRHLGVRLASSFEPEGNHAEKSRQIADRHRSGFQPKTRPCRRPSRKFSRAGCCLYCEAWATISSTAIASPTALCPTAPASVVFPARSFRHLTRSSRRPPGSSRSSKPRRSGRTPPI